MFSPMQIENHDPLSSATAAASRQAHFTFYFNLAVRCVGLFALSFTDSTNQRLFNRCNRRAHWGSPPFCIFKSACIERIC